MSWSSLIGDAMPALGLLCATGILTTAAWQVETALQESAEVHRYQDQVLAGLQAESGAFAVLAEQTRKGVLRPGSGSWSGVLGLPVEVVVQFGDQQAGLRVEVEGRRGRRYRYRGPLLPGAAPRCLGYNLALPTESLLQRPRLRAWLKQHLDVAVSPLPSDQQLEHLLDADLALGSEPWPAVQEDSSIGLLRLARGSDRLDFRPVETVQHLWRPAAPLGGVARIPGNLWIPADPRPLVVELQAPLTVVVDGNLYLDRSLVVRGQGALTLVLRAAGSTRFVDRDGDGAHSSGEPGRADGAVEGGGNVYLGRHAPPRTELEVSANLVAEGEVYLGARRSSLHAATVVFGGLTWLRPEAELQLSGDQLSNVERQRLPGFRVRGAPRPGLLERVD